MSHIVFDFDGTLADSLPVLLKVYNELAPKWGTNHISQADWPRLRQLPFTQGIKEIGVRPYRIPALLAEGKRELQAHSHEIELFPDVPNLIRQLHDDGYQLHILSTNSTAVVRTVLDKAELNPYLGILRSSRYFGKAQALRRFLKQNKVSARDVWMVGDELRDGAGARKVGIRFVAVSWGFQPAEVLSQENPVAIVRKPSDIRKIIRDGRG